MEAQRPDSPSDIAPLADLLTHARLTPDLPALVVNGEALTYGGFVGAVAALQAWLATLGVAAGQLAFVQTARTEVSWPLLFALQWLGLDTVVARTPADVGVLAGTRPAWLFASSDLDVRAWSAAAPGVRVAKLPRLPTADAGAEPRVVAPPGGHWLLTSGTTGSLKPLRVDGEVERARWTRREAPRPSLCMFNFGLWTFAGYQSAQRCWAAGGTVSRWDAPEPWRALRQPGLKRAVVTPPMLGRLLDAPERALAYDPGLALDITGGTAPWRLIEAARARITPNIYSHLGTTEMGVFAITRLDTPEDLRWHRLLPAREVQVADDAGRALPAGQVGRLRLRLAEGDAPGYADTRDAGAGAFVNGWFYSGDLGELSADGRRLRLHGRANDVISLHGAKKPTLPIEQALEAALGATTACVLGLPREDGRDEVHVVLEGLSSLPPAAVLNAAALEHLQGFARANYHIVERLPRNAGDKIDRIALMQAIRTTGRP